jgi:hypothetical protein
MVDTMVVLVVVDIMGIFCTTCSAKLFRGVSLRDFFGEGLMVDLVGCHVALWAIPLRRFNKPSMSQWTDFLARKLSKL